MLRELAFNLGGEAVRFLRQGGEPCGVDGIGAAVMGTQGDVPLVGMVDEAFDMAAVELLQGVAAQAVVAHPAEKIDEFLVGLPVDMLQLDGQQFSLAQPSAAEKIGRVVVGLQQPPFGIFYHR